jgi:predicted flap endonuclease-1-like 5' DNA nuclease
MLIRFGWIDQEDWSAQQAQTGQAAGLPDSVYKGKLIEIPGEYRRKSPVQVIKGIGSKRSEELSALGIRTVQDLISYSGSDMKIKKLLESLDQDFLV